MRMGLDGTIQAVWLVKMVKGEGRTFDTQVSSKFLRKLSGDVGRVAKPALFVFALTLRVMCHWMI